MPGWDPWSGSSLLWRLLGECRRVSAHLKECAGAECEKKHSVFQETQGAKLRSQVTWQSLLLYSLSLEEQPVY